MRLAATVLDMSVAAVGVVGLLVGMATYWMWVAADTVARKMMTKYCPRTNTLADKADDGKA